MKQLLMDTSSKAMSVALVDDEQVVMEITMTGKKNHSLTLMPAIENMMKETGWKPTDLERIVTAKGPGSYTGVRIAVTTAKTLAWTLNIPLSLVSSLALLARNEEGGIIIPLIDARRNHVYAGIYRVTPTSIESLLADGYYDFKSILDFASDYEAPIFTGETRSFIEQIETLPQAIYRQEGKKTLPQASLLNQIKGEVVEGEAIHLVVPDYLKKVEAEEKWEETHHATTEEKQNFVQKTK